MLMCTPQYWTPGIEGDANMETHKKSVLHDKNAVRFLRYLSCFSALPIFLRHPGKFRNAQGFTANGFGQSGSGDAVDDLRLGKAAEARGQAVDQGFSPLGKAGVYHLEEQLFVGDGAGGRSPAPEGDDRRGDLGLGNEAGGGHVE